MAIFPWEQGLYQAIENQWVDLANLVMEKMSINEAHQKFRHMYELHDDFPYGQIKDGSWDQIRFRITTRVL